ncbi:MAG: gliding motility-associated protein GldE [Bacteroidales bacterium]|nr:gliding motility-associated protein GldE [Bacteroidales bacterium]
MEQIDDPFPDLFFIINSVGQAPLDYNLLMSLLALVILLFFSALISGSETSFFSLNSVQLEEIDLMDTSKSKLLISLLNRPKQLLATILIANNFVNVAIVILSAFITGLIFNFAEFPIIGFVIEIVLVTFILLLLGEITPKIYANQHNVKFALMVTKPLSFIHKILLPLSKVLAFSTAIVDKRITKKGHDISKSELDDAIELTVGENSSKEEKDMLKGIVKFADMETSEIMKARVDISAINYADSINDVMAMVVKSGFSRIPVFQESLDKIVGILYIKDLLPYFDEPSKFEWTHLIRQVLFIPENKKVNELLQEFRKKKIHLAIVVDEYGGTSGLITLEDILEEIVGEINDEFDLESTNIDFEKINSTTYVFAAKTSIIDFSKVLEIDEDIFDDIEGDYDSLAGLFLELFGNIPQKGSTVSFQDYKFEVIELDYKRIKRIKITVDSI